MTFDDSRRAMPARRARLQLVSPLAKTQRYIVRHCLSGDSQPWCYHTQFSYHLHIEGWIAPLFFKAMKTVIGRHPIMKTVLFDRGDGEVWQGIDPELDAAIDYRDIGGLPPEQHDAWIGEFLFADRNRPFDMLDSHAALVRAFMIRRSPEALQLVLVFHHAIWDGWSLAVLVKEILDFYRVLRTTPTATLPAADYDYREFIDSEALTSRSTEARSWWAVHLRDHCGYRARPHRFHAKTDAYEPLNCMLGAELVARLDLCARQQRITLKSLFIALFIAMVHDESQQTHTTIGVVSNGRGVQLKNPLTTLGLLWNLAPLCVKTVSPVTAWAEYVVTVHRALMESAPFSGYPLLDLLRDQQVGELFHAVFNYIDFGGANIVQKDSGIRFLASGGLDKFHFPLYLLVGRNPFDRNISLVLNFDSRCYDAHELKECLDRYVARLWQWCHEVAA